MDTVTSTPLTPVAQAVDGLAPRASAEGDIPQDRAFGEALDREIAVVLAETLAMQPDLAQTAVPAATAEGVAALDASQQLLDAVAGTGIHPLQAVEATAAEVARDAAALALHTPSPAQPGLAPAADPQLTPSEPASTLMESMAAAGGREARQAHVSWQLEERMSASAAADARDAAAAPEAFLALVGSERFAPAETALSTFEVAAPVENLTSAALAAKWTAVQGRTEAASAPATARVDTPLGAPGWGEAFQQKIVWLVDRAQQSAELHVNPPHLGPVDVMLDLTESGARIAFASPHATVREAIEASLSELRSALAERGVALGEAHVSADPGSAREQLQGETERASGHRRGGSGPIAAQFGAPEVHSRPVQVGLVDIFA